MEQIKVVKQTVHLLHLTEDQAKWLKGIMQNPLHSDDPMDESPLDAEMRVAFFNSLNEVSL